jgi:hypothetical protein
MDERPPKASSPPREVTDLVSELSELVENLGLEERAAPPGPGGRRRVRPAGPRPGAGAAAVAAEIDPAAAPELDDPLLDDIALWVPPPEALEPGGRPWSPAAAMEMLPGSRGAAAPAVDAGPPSSWVMTVAASVAVALALLAILVSRIDLAQTTGPDHAISAAPFAVTALRTVAADSLAAVAASPTTTRFAAATSHLFIDIHYSGATPHDTLELRVIHDSDGIPPPTVVQDHTYTLDTADGEGTVTIELTAPSGVPFAPGRYTVSVVHGQSAAQSIDFTVGGARNA